MTEMDDDTPQEVEETPVDQGLEIARMVYTLRNAAAIPNVDPPTIQATLLSTLEERGSADLYVKYCEEFGWMVEEAKVTAMRTKTDEELKGLDERIVDAEANHGDSEVKDALQARAEFFARVGKRDEAIAAFKKTEEKTVAVGQKMDLMFSLLRLDFIHEDYPAVKKDLEIAKKLFEEGGDWERKNRLKVYEGLFFMAIRDFNKAAALFLESIATFTTYELFSYKTFIFYTVATAIVALDRVTLKEKVVDAPEILTVIDQMPALAQFMNSLHSCQYGKFFSSFCDVTDMVVADMYLQPHYRYFMRQVRMVAYAQFLDSYKSVTLVSMATSFGVSPEFLDKELSSFISAGRLNCKMDKMAGIVESNRPDAKNALYRTIIKQGDLVLNRVQKLSKVIDL